jgi:hypothetical protein
MEERTMLSLMFRAMVAGRSASRHATFRPTLELCEDRVVPSAVSPEEQLLVYQINLARNDPEWYAQTFLKGETDPKTNVPMTTVLNSTAYPHHGPMAVNDHLFDSADQKAQVLPSTPFGQGVPNAPAPHDGYKDLIASTGYPTTHVWESLDFGSAYAALALDDFLRDPSDSNNGHRNHMFSDYREVGVGHYSGPSYWGDYWAVHTGTQDWGDRFVTGVVFNDSKPNFEYDLNEGIAGVTVKALVPDGKGGMKVVASTTTNAAGGYSLLVPEGTYTITAQGPGFYGTATQSSVVVGPTPNKPDNHENVEVDFISGLACGVVNFLLPPQLSGPATASAGGTVTLTWTASPQAAGYWISWSREWSPSPFEVEGWMPVPIHVSGTSYTMTNLQPGTYRFRVWATDAAGQQGLGSSQLELQVADTGPQPKVTAPSGAPVGGSASITWTTVPGAASFRILGVLKPASGGNEVWISIDVSGTSYKLTNLQAGTYMLVVAPSDASGFPLRSSDLFTITTGQRAPGPMPIVPIRWRYEPVWRLGPGPQELGNSYSLGSGGLRGSAPQVISMALVSAGTPVHGGLTAFSDEVLAAPASQAGSGPPAHEARSLTAHRPGHELTVLDEVFAALASGQLLQDGRHGR